MVRLMQTFANKQSRRSLGALSYVQGRNHAKYIDVVGDAPAGRSRSLIAT